MATRTYVRTLVNIVRTLCIYVARYDVTIMTYLPENAKAPYGVLKDACAGFMDAIGELPTNP